MKACTGGSFHQGKALLEIPWPMPEKPPEVLGGEEWTEVRKGLSCQSRVTEGHGRLLGPKEPSVTLFTYEFNSHSQTIFSVWHSDGSSGCKVK